MKNYQNLVNIGIRDGLEKIPKPDKLKSDIEPEK